MTSYVGDDLRRLVTDRAQRHSEYWLIHEEDTFFGCEVDHIISIKHGGPTGADNLAFACVLCNRRKGSDIGSILRRTGEFIRFFNPRTDHWEDHFRLGGPVIEPLTEIGEVTARILDFNDDRRILEREALIGVGRYPPESLKNSTPLGGMRRGRNTRVRVIASDVREAISICGRALRLLHCVRNDNHGCQFLGSAFVKVK